MSIDVRPRFGKPPRVFHFIEVVKGHETRPLCGEFSIRDGRTFDPLKATCPYCCQTLEARRSKPKQGDLDL